jgi:hypothetical protein
MIKARALGRKNAGDQISTNLHGPGVFPHLQAGAVRRPLSSKPKPDESKKVPKLRIILLFHTTISEPKARSTAQPNAAWAATPQVPFLAAGFLAPGLVWMAFAGGVSATGSDAGKVSSRASSSISSSVGGRFGVGFSMAACWRFGAGFMAFSKVTLVPGE